MKPGILLYRTILLPFRLVWKLTADRHAPGLEPFPIERGEPEVIDGMTIVAGEKRIRIAGMVTPSTETAEGRKAAHALARIIAPRFIHAVPVTRMPDGTFVARLYSGRGEISRIMVREGHAAARSTKL